MDRLIERFLKKIGVEDTTPYEKAYFSKLINDKEQNKIIACIHLDRYLSIDVYDKLLDAISYFPTTGGFSIKLSFEYDDESIGIKDFLDQFIEKYSCTLLDDVKIFDQEKKLLFSYSSAAYASDISDETKKLKDWLDSITSSYKVLTQEKVHMEEFKDKVENRYIKSAKIYKEQLDREKELSNTYQPCRLKDVENFNKVLVTGKIFKLGEDRKTKNGLTIRVIEYTDGSDSIQSTLFEGKKMTLTELLSYDVGVNIKVMGTVFRDQYSRNELSIRVDSIEKMPEEPIRQDDYPEKRVELHLHSKMSTFDGVTYIKDYVKRAALWGHKAIAITDHGGCQAFPDAQEAAKKFNIKMLYGSELYMVDDTSEAMHYIYNPSDRKLKDSNYVIFDTETTGLSSRYDRLIEFGAVKMDSTGQITDSIDFFINPDMKISGFAVEKSHIRQEQVDRGKSIKEALKMIKAFFGDDILVAHNASFDFDFLNEAFKNNGMETIKNPVIDTLAISRYLYPDMRSHREETLARKFDIEFDAEGAHRANYDAEHLAKIFESMLYDLEKNNRDIRHSDLLSLPVSKEMFLGLHPYHVIAFVKNSDGLKELYRIISESNINNMSKQGNPLVTRSYLQDHRKDLLISSACFNGEVFEAGMTKGEDKLIEKMKFYDYIEVQPVANYSYLIHDGQLTDEEAVRKIIKDIIKAAKDIGKLVVATGDCHYLDPENKINRDVYIVAGGLKGARHPLYLGPRESAKDEVKKKWYKNPIENPDQHFRTTSEMIDAFKFLNDEELIKEIVITNSNKIADMISGDIKPTKDKLYPPFVPGTDKLLSDLAYKTAKEMYGDPLPEIIEDRLKLELNGIITNGYSVIYWLSSQIVRWSNSEGYLIGSRGSVGSSLVATMTGITEVNPLPPHYRCPKCHHLEWADLSLYQSGFDLPDKVCPECGCKMIGDGQNIPFATFLGFHAEKVPDIDLNFPSDFQSIAHEHMKEILNSTGNTCYKAGTIQTSQEKNARGYVLGYFESLGKDTKDIRSAEIDRIAMGCIDTKRTTGQHPGGVIVIPKGMEVYDFTPVQYPADETDSTWMTTHYDFHKIHDNVLKFDMLGHVDPQAIRMQCDMCGFSFLDMKEKIPISDIEAHSLFWSTEALHLKDNLLKQETGALGLPEFGTENGRRVLIETQPRSFSDLVRISGLSHGTDVFAGNAEVLITKEKFKLSDVIACRDDIMTVLHEKYNIDNSDAFAIMEFTRKGMFGKPGNDEKKEKFIKIMKDHDVPEWYINSCKLIKYMFPKAHAVAYVTNCIRCAWFKVHKPLAYYATYFTLRCEQFDIKSMIKGADSCLKLRQEILNKKASKQKVTPAEEDLILSLESTIELYDRGYHVAPISVLKSKACEFAVDEANNAVIPSLKCVSGLGDNIAKQIVKARDENMFTSVEDLKSRARIGDGMIEKLRDVGALEDLPDSEQMSLEDFF